MGIPYICSQRVISILTKFQLLDSLDLDVRSPPSLSHHHCVLGALKTGGLLTKEGDNQKTSHLRAWALGQIAGHKA